MNTQHKVAHSKRSRDSNAADSVEGADEIKSGEERAVRQRVGLAASSSAASASVANASSATVPSTALHIARLSFLSLAVVERQLVMQGLDIEELARLSSTCKQMRGEALHKEAGKFIPKPNPSGRLGQLGILCDNHPAHASPLFRQHLQTLLTFVDTDSEAERQALMDKASQFARITDLDSVPDDWAEAQVLHLLAQPWLQSVTHVNQKLSAEWLNSSLVQHALFALPQRELQESAVKLATKLRSAYFFIDPQRSQDILALRVLSGLSSFGLFTRLSAEDVNSALGPLVWCLPRTLTSLTLVSFSLEPESTPRSALKAMFLRLPKLITLHTQCCMEMRPLLQGMLDAGVDALPDLCRVQFDDVASNDDSDVLRRFLHKFTAVTVCFYLGHDSEEGLMEHYRMVRTYGAWPRVEFEMGPTDNLPSPHASDDDAESDVEAAADPHQA